ncbi:oligosaccharide flippase family protein [Streptomyces sp. A3M-1-3]|uniref:oligosaccharide flippase family protein n=1 Tax=Streptomyces sp. A3M-1-3 TaxID=2962044 RepID=UPI0020B85654|nr:oligosaccharide flippase family protein [Streptomyces sp. A3M-1-3]MCP3819739.1 oligosaccharide flippase family protein [Streptomyces sp. A3M-1-3]
MTAPGTAVPDAEEAAIPTGVAATARGGWWAFLGSGANAVFGFVLVVLTTRSVGLHEAGAVFTGVAVFTILSNACKLGADTGLVRFVSRDLAMGGGREVEALVRTAVVPGALAGTTAAALLFSASPLSASLLPQMAPADAQTLIRLFALFLPVATVSMLLLGATRGYGTVLPFVGVEQIGKPLLRVLLAVPVAVLAPGVLTLAAAWLVPSLAGAVGAWLALRRCRAAHTGTPRQPGGALPWREFWSFAAPRAMSSVLDIGAIWVGVILLSALATTEEAGLYTAIGRVITAGTLLQLAIRLAVAPEISRLLALGETDQARGLHRISTRWIVLFSWPLFVMLACFPATVLSVFGAGFGEGAGALLVLCAASVVNISVGNAQTVLLMAGKSSWHLAVTGAAFAVQLATGLFAVPRWGVVGAAVSWGVAIIVENLASAWLVRHRLGFTTIDGGYLAAAGVGLCLVTALALPVRLLAGDTARGLAAGIALTVCVLSITLWRYKKTLGVNDLVCLLRRRTSQPRHSRLPAEPGTP